MAENKPIALATPGKVRLYHKDGGTSDHYPVDANEILAHPDSEYSTEPFGEVEEAEETQPETDLHKMKKAELIALAENKGIDTSANYTKEELISLLS